MNKIMKKFSAIVLAIGLCLLPTCATAGISQDWRNSALEEGELNTFAKLQALIADKTLLNEEDANGHVTFSGDSAYTRVTKDSTDVLPALGVFTRFIVDNLDGSVAMAIMAKNDLDARLYFGDPDSKDSGSIIYNNLYDAWEWQTNDVQDIFTFFPDNTFTQIIDVLDSPADSTLGGANFLLEAGDADPNGNLDGGDFTINAGAKSGSGSDGQVKLQSAGTDFYTTSTHSIIGDAGSTSHSLNTNDDLFVSGKLEVDGEAYFDGPATYGTSLYISTILRFEGGYTNFKPAESGDGFILGLRNGGVSDRMFIITQSANLNKNHDHTPPSNPTLFVHSDTDPDTDNTQWISVSHDQTNGVIDVGSGKLTTPDAFQADDYYSGDGTQGFTGSCGSATTLTVKDGLITACA